MRVVGIVADWDRYNCYPTHATQWYSSSNLPTRKSGPDGSFQGSI